MIEEFRRNPNVPDASKDAFDSLCSLPGSSISLFEIADSGFGLLCAEKLRGIKEAEQISQGLHAIRKQIKSDRELRRALCAHSKLREAEAFEARDTQLDTLSSLSNSAVLYSDCFLSAFARDRFLGAEKNGKRYLIQGKPKFDIDVPPLATEMKEDEVKVALHPWWKGQYARILNNELRLRMYELGDILVCESNMLVGGQTIRENVDEPGKGRLSLQEMIEEFRKIAGGRKITAIERPRFLKFLHHLDLFADLMPDGTVIVADLRQVTELLKQRGFADQAHENAYQKLNPCLRELRAFLRESGFNVGKAPAYMRLDFQRQPVLQIRGPFNNIKNGSEAFCSGFGEGFEELDETCKEIYARHGYNLISLKSFGGLNSLLNIEEWDTMQGVFYESGPRCVANVLSRS
jgi:hypothetical protein